MPISVSLYFKNFGAHETKLGVADLTLHTIVLILALAKHEALGAFSAAVE